MKTQFLLIGAILATIACKGPKEDSPIDAHFSPDSVATAEIREDCFQYVNGNDTIRLRIQPEEVNVSGELAYLFFEKDKSWGTIEGTLRDSLLIAEYTFLSEGDTSTRQVVFKRFEEGWKEGYGDIQELDGVVTYKNIDSLDYGHEVNLVPIPCDQFVSKLE
ncbi:hypothetical protein J0A67_16575 [Algoriphagus aestuariicola]|uniref:Lipoprotein n=1 Tax=Algoriphagus aestuariicola TaxID=1852016 RepID=A0ABS3BW06_9BACT|nr:hypothetical protein [Algoriphagus aestuariicola]MBN7802491.1 hypothetical protein [Algoriphagus aestuariicola]